MRGERDTERREAKGRDAEWLWRIGRSPAVPMSRSKGGEDVESNPFGIKVKVFEGDVCKCRMQWVSVPGQHAALAATAQNRHKRRMRCPKTRNRSRFPGTAWYRFEQRLPWRWNCFDGALARAPRPPATFRVWPMISRVQAEKHVLVGAPPFYMGAEPIGMWLYRAYGVPWIANDIHERLKSVTQEEYEALDLAPRTSGRY
jgi:hypothetical protein